MAFSVALIQANHMPQKQARGHTQQAEQGTQQPPKAKT
jgi:hypothetical protein